MNDFTQKVVINESISTEDGLYQNATRIWLSPSLTWMKAKVFIKYAYDTKLVGLMPTRLHDKIRI